MISPVAIGVSGWNDMATLMPLTALLSRAGKYIGLEKQHYHVVVHQNGSNFTLNFLKNISDLWSLYHERILLLEVSL